MPAKPPARPRAIEYVALDELEPTEGNPKEHRVESIQASISTLGFVDAVIRDGRTGRLLAGHGRREALLGMRAAGQDPPEGIIATESTWLVPVQVGWSSTSDAAATTALLTLNRLTELGGWSPEPLLDMLDNLDDTLRDIAGWDAEMIAALETESRAQHDGFAPRTDPDTVPPVPTTPVTRKGDLWLLGEHRLICGDATNLEVHQLLLGSIRPDALLCDPPYGINLDTDFSTMKGSLKSIGRAGGTRGKTYDPVVGDDEDYDPRPVRALCTDVTEQFWFGADYYSDRIPDHSDGAWLVWDKRKENQADAYGSEFELLWSRRRHKRRILRHDWFGFLSSQNGADARARTHPTQKPVTLLTDILEQWTKPGGLIADFYAGSGSTLIACVATGRTACCSEILPVYCDVICRRFEELTGTLPVLERTGKPRSFTG